MTARRFAYYQDQYIIFMQNFSPDIACAMPG